MHQQQTAFENIEGNEEIACNKQFLLLPQCFLLNQITVSPFVHIFDNISLFAAELEEPKIGILGKGLGCHVFMYTITGEACSMKKIANVSAKNTKSDPSALSR